MEKASEAVRAQIHFLPLSTSEMRGTEPCMLSLLAPVSAAFQLSVANGRYWWETKVERREGLGLSSLSLSISGRAVAVAPMWGTHRGSKLLPVIWSRGSGNTTFSLCSFTLRVGATSYSCSSWAVAFQNLHHLWNQFPAPNTLCRRYLKWFLFS